MNKVNEIAQALIADIDFRDLHLTATIQNDAHSYNAKFLALSQIIYVNDKDWLEHNKQTASLDEAREVATAILKHFNQHPIESQFDTSIKNSIAHALNKKSKSNLSLFNPKRIRDYLYQHSISVSDSKLAILAVEALNKDYDENINIDLLCKKLNAEFEFKKRFINQKVTPVNEYQLQAFCQAYNIAYPDNINWKPIIFRILRLHVSTMYQKDYANYQLNKPKETKIMPTDAINANSDVSRFLEEPVGLPTFNRPVTTGITYTVNGKDVETMSKQDLFDCTIAIKNSIYFLSPMKKESKAVKKEIKHQKKILKVVIKYLDAK